jgi:hypothetical protein
VIATVPFLDHGVQKQKERCPSFRCFQLFGFDILLDAGRSPHLLEVNYRPSLGSDTQGERDLKRRILTGAWNRVLGSGRAVGTLKDSLQEWRDFLGRQRHADFHRIIPSPHHWEILSQSKRLSVEFDPLFDRSWRVPVLDAPLPSPTKAAMPALPTTPRTPSSRMSMRPPTPRAAPPSPRAAVSPRLEAKRRDSHAVTRAQPANASRPPIKVPSTGRPTV